MVFYIDITLNNIGIANFWISYSQQGQKAPLSPQPFTVPHSIAISNRRTAARHSNLPKDSNNSEDSNKEINSAIKNPVITKYKSRPVTKIFKAATEKLIISYIHVKAIVRLGTIVQDVRKK
ncbi:17339_t:CDS:2, partial [Gigaspora margarita]